MAQRVVIPGFRKIETSGGGEGGTTNYNDLKNKPSINGVEIDGNKTLDDLGIQPKGEYITEETDPTVPQWAKENTKPTYTASEVGADSAGSANIALSDAKEYTDNKIAELINGAPETLDTLKEIADALKTEQSTVEVLQEAIGTKLNKDGDSKDNTVTFVQSETRENIDSGDKHSVLFGKIRKWLFDLKEVAFSGSYTDLNNKPSAEDIGALPKDGNATSATKATNDGDGNNIAETYATKTKVDGVESQITTNLLKPTLQTTEQNGVTCTNNGDGTYTVDGTATADVSFNLAGLTLTGTYKILGAPKSEYVNKFYVGGKEVYYAPYSGKVYTYDNTTIGYEIAVTSGTTVNKELVKPMITTNLDATYDDFVPYTGDTGQLNSDVASLLKRIEALESITNKTATTTVESE